MAAGAVGTAGFATGMWAMQVRSDEASLAQQMAREVSEAATSIAARAEQAMIAEVTAAATISQLRAALRNRIDAATLEDLFSSEDWWAPYRERSTAIVAVAWTLVARPAQQIMPDLQIAVRARKEGPVAALETSAGAAKLVAAAPVTEAPGEPVLTFARPLDAALLGEWARAGGTPLAVTDGQRLVAASEEELGHLALAGHERDAAFPTSARLIVAASPIGTGLWLWMSRPRPAVPRAGRVWIWGVTALAILVAVVLALIGRRSQAASTPVREPGRALDDAGSDQPRQDDPDGLFERRDNWAGATRGSGPDRRRATGDRSTGTRPSPGASATSSGVLRRFGRYELVERIGEGGMSDIYTATMRGAKGFERVLVVKRLKRELSANRAAVEQFTDEARLGSLLVHPNIAQVYDFGELDDGYFMALEYVPGRNVNQIVERHVERLGRGLDPATVFYLVHDVLQALSYAHERRNANGDPLVVVHRDVSPANVMISTRGDVKLLDFGIVKSEDRISQSDIANIKGNPGFMAPEQARGLPVDARSDLFSVGLVMYYAMTGHMLYRMGTAGETLFQAATGPSREQLDSILALPQPAARIIARALGAEPEDRFRSADEFAAALAPEVRQGARSQMVNLLQSLFGFEFQLEGVPTADRSTPVRPRAV